MDMTLINSDIALFKTSFPSVYFDWNEITFVTHDECLPEYLSRHKGYDPKDRFPIFYSPTTNTVVHDDRLMIFDYVRYHEMGHVVHDKLLDNKRHIFSNGWQKSLTQHWDIPNYSRSDHLERFADVFTETMLRLKHDCIMDEFNDELIDVITRANMKKELYSRPRVNVNGKSLVVEVAR